MATEQDEARLVRVKELEAMVHKLTVENEKLMTRVHPPSTAQLPDEEKPSPTQHSSPGERLIHNDEDTEEGVIALSDLDETGEDEWLFVSPMKPPTPKQKNITPTEWLSGETISRFSEKNLPSLNEVRKTLAASMDEAEQFVKSPKYLNRVRQKRKSPTGGSDGSSPRSLSPAEQSPLLSKKQRNVPIRPVIPHGSGKNSTERSTQQASLKVKRTPPKSNADLEEDNVPVTNSLKVKWDPSKAVPSDDDEENEEELEELRAKWKIRVPVEGETDKQVNPLKVNWTARVPDEGNEVEEKLKVKWKARMPVGDNEEEQVNPLKVKWTAQVPAEDYEEEGDPVPVVKWKARMPVEDNEEETEKQVNPLKVKWTAQVPAEDYEEEEEEGDPVPVVKWKARMPVEDNEEDEDTEKQVNPLKVNWTARVPAEDYEEEEERDPVSVVKWKAKQVPEPEEEIPKVQWTVRNVGDPHQSRNQQRPSPNSSATQSLRGNLTPPSQHPKAASNPLKIQWNPNKASPASSEEDLSSQGSGESPQPQRVSRYSASKLAYPQTTPSPTASGLPGRSARPVASVSPLQKGNLAISPVQKRSSGLRQPSPARTPGAAAARLTSPQSQPNQAVRARSLSPDQGAQLSSSNHKNPSPQSRLRSPGTASLGRRGGMKLMKPSGQVSGTTRSTERSSVVPQQGSPSSRPQATKQLPSPQQRRITPTSSARSQGLQKPSSGIRQPSSLRRPAARGGTAQTPQARPAKDKWLEDCF